MKNHSKWHRNPCWKLSIAQSAKDTWAMWTTPWHDIPFYWLVHRDSYNALFKSLNLYHEVFMVKNLVFRCQNLFFNGFRAPTTNNPRFWSLLTSIWAPEWATSISSIARCLVGFWQGFSKKTFLAILLVTFFFSKAKWPSTRGSKGHELNHLVRIKMLVVIHLHLVEFW